MKLFRTVFAGTAMAAFVASTPVSPGVTFEANDNSIVSKTVVSSNMRLVFMAGLEGTGHHYVVEVNNHLLDNNTNLDRVSDEDGVEHALYEIGRAMGHNVLHYNETLNAARNNMRKLAERGASLKSPGAMVLMHGRNSYPHGFGPNKALKYLDLRTLAEVAEEAGVDLRVLYLRRSVKNITIANTIHRQFQTNLHNPGESTPEQKYMQYMQVLLTDIAVVHSFLAELDPRFVVCLDFDRAGDVDQSASVADFLAPNRDVAEPLKTSFVEVAAARAKSNETLLYEGANVVAARLQRKFDAFESQLCSGNRWG